MKQLHAFLYASDSGSVILRFGKEFELAKCFDNE